MTGESPDDRGGQPDLQDVLPDAVPAHVRERLLSGRSVQASGQTGEGGI